MMNFFQNIPTELHLNGPNVGFSSVPLDANANIAGVATFTAIGTASFPYNNVNGSFSFDWYFDGKIIKDTFLDSTSNASIETNGSLGITTMTLSGITGDDDQKKVYVVANYIPGPDESIIDYPGESKGSGDSRDTGDAAVLSSPPTLVITKQPKSSLIGSGNTAVFEVEAAISPTGPGDISYQWSLEGETLTDGTTSRQVEDAGDEVTYPLMTVTSDAGDNFTLDWSELSVFSDFETGRQYTLKTSVDFEATLTLEGAAGGTSLSRSVVGGSGGRSRGVFKFAKDHEYKLIVGDGGGDGTSTFDPRRLRSYASGGAAGYGGGGSGGGGTGVGGGGGGYTGLFSGPISIGNAVIIAGGGGGGANDPAQGGDGGGETGGASGNAGRGGAGGTQTGGGGAGGQDGTSATAGSALQGGPGAAGGGGGYYGGGGGQFYNGCCADGAGGGGSSYIGGQAGHPITNAETITGGAANAGEGVRVGSFVIERRTPTIKFKTITTTITGSRTSSLKIFSNDQEFGGSVKCTVSSTNVINSPVDSTIVSYDVTIPRAILEFEAYTNDNKYKSLIRDIDSFGQFVLNADTFGSEYGIIQFHSRDKDVIVKLDMNAAKGSPQVNGYSEGGEGGTSVISFKAHRNEEYTILGISNNSAIFLYRKANLIAVVGKGGNGGRNGAGGKGGGVNVDGEGGLGGAGRPGLPGKVVTPTLTGIWGSQANRLVPLPTLYEGDLIADDGLPLSTGLRRTDGGTTISCSKGRHFVEQGIAPCSDISTGEVQFTNTDGTLIQDSSSLYRGFKAGYTVTVTGGAFDGECGDGGAGVNGGGGGRSGTCGGGGGAGYADGSVTVISSKLGGNNTTNSFIVFGEESDTSGLFVDSAGRILILSCATSALSPTLLTKTTGQVLVDTDTCIDDARWQAFINLASSVDGYRLTATRNNDTLKIVTPTDNNIRKMLNSNRLALRTSLTGWQTWDSASPTTGYGSDLLLAWDEDSEFAGTGGDYSGLYWNVPGTGYTPGFAYYGESSNPPFVTTNYHFDTANWWILPPGVPDFSQYK